MNHYGKRYHLTFNDKTKVVVTGSKHDMAYYKEMSPWTLNGKKISVVDENEASFVRFKRRAEKC